MRSHACWPGALLALVLSAHAPSQVSWSKVGPEIPPQTLSHCIAYDAVRGRTLLFHGGRSASTGSSGETWEWDGALWFQRFPFHTPSDRVNFALAYDSARQRVVLFGGWNGTTHLSDTWEWDGGNWQLASPTTRPPGRYLHALAYDARRGRTVLFGGYGRTGFLSDTWEWDGTDWIQASPPVSPSARWHHAIAYDARHQRVVLFGGAVGAYVPLSDTWAWDGANWTRLASANSPPPRYRHAITYDSARGRIVLYGGAGTALPVYSDTWEWDGTDWSRQAPTGNPAPQYYHSLAYDSTRGRTVLHGAVLLPGGGFTGRSDTWEYDGSRWTRWTAGPHPPFRACRTMAYDAGRGRTVLYGDSRIADTWEWNGSAWTMANPTASPPALYAAAMAYDIARSRTVLFGGHDGALLSSQTWEYDGATWRQVLTVTSPPPRYFHVMAYDLRRQRLVLFGGSAGGICTALSDTWEYDGIDWTKASPASTPPARKHPVMAHDAVRGRTVLFGGRGNNCAALTDTWEYDGSDWIERFPSAAPSAIDAGAMVYDFSRGRMVAVGGGETWEYDGTAWRRRLTATFPPTTVAHAMAYDIARGRTVLFGVPNEDTWEYGADRLAAYGVFGAACRGSSGLLSLGVESPSLPWLGEAFTVLVGNIPQGMPAILFLGKSRTTWGPVSLPFGLDAIGMGGCTLYASGEFVLPLGAAGGIGKAQFSVPASGDLLGTRFYNQAFAADPRANPAGATASNGGEGSIGGK